MHSMNPLMDKYNITKSSWVMVEADQPENVNETFCQSCITRSEHAQYESPHGEYNITKSSWGYSRDSQEGKC